MLVEAGVSGVEVGEGVSHFGDGTDKANASGVASEGSVEGAFMNGMDRAGFVVDGGFHVHPGAVAAVAGMGGDNAAVARGAFAYHDAGATLAIEFRLA